MIVSKALRFGSAALLGSSLIAALVLVLTVPPGS